MADDFTRINFLLKTQPKLLILTSGWGGLKKWFATPEGDWVKKVISPSDCPVTLKILKREKPFESVGDMDFLASCAAKHLENGFFLASDPLLEIWWRREINEFLSIHAGHTLLKTFGFPARAEDRIGRGLWNEKNNPVGSAVLNWMKNSQGFHLSLDKVLRKGRPGGNGESDKKLRKFLKDLVDNYSGQLTPPLRGKILKFLKTPTDLEGLFGLDFLMGKGLKEGSPQFHEAHSLMSQAYLDSKELTEIHKRECGKFFEFFNPLFEKISHDLKEKKILTPWGLLPELKEKSLDGTLLLRVSSLHPVFHQLLTEKGTSKVLCQEIEGTDTGFIPDMEIFSPKEKKGKGIGYKTVENIRQQIQTLPGYPNLTCGWVIGPGRFRHWREKLSEFNPSPLWPFPQPQSPIIHYLRRFLALWHEPYSPLPLAEILWNYPYSIGEEGLLYLKKGDLFANPEDFLEGPIEKVEHLFSDLKSSPFVDSSLAPLKNFFGDWNQLKNLMGQFPPPQALRKWFESNSFVLASPLGEINSEQIPRLEGLLLLWEEFLNLPETMQNLIGFSEKEILENPGDFRDFFSPKFPPKGKNWLINTTDFSIDLDIVVFLDVPGTQFANWGGLDPAHLHWKLAKRFPLSPLGKVACRDSVKVLANQARVACFIPERKLKRI